MPITMTTTTSNNNDSSPEVEVFAPTTHSPYDVGLYGLLTPGQVIRMIGCSDAGLRKWRLQGKIKAEAVTPGGQHRYHPAEVVRFIRTMRKEYSK